MKYIRSIQFGFCLILAVVLCGFSLSLTSCSSDSSDSSVSSDTDDSNDTGSSDDTDDTGDYTGNSFTLDYTFGTYSGSYDNIYVIWAENPDEDFYYPIYICKRLIDGSLTGTALPYWKVNKYPEMDSAEIDAVTHATIKRKGFSVSFDLPDDAPDKFTVYFETDVYYNDNDWFYQNQPATLYKAEIDRNNLQEEYVLEFIGWTPNEANVSNEENYNYITSVELVLGGLQGETGYISYHKDPSSTPWDDVFGDADDNPQTNLVDSIVVTPPVSME